MTLLRLMVFMLPIGTAGCDLLQTRDPEPPAGGSATFTPPTSYDLVIPNLEAAVREKNSTNYRQCLVDSTYSNRQYQFQPTPERVNEFVDWTVALEVTSFEKLSLSKPDGISDLSFSSTSYSSQPPDEAVLTAKYRLVFQHNDNTLAQEARGNIQMNLVLDQRGWWRIYHWVDLRDTSETTWSDFKAKFR